MPGLDPNIILQANQPTTQLQNPMDTMGKMMQMKSLADQSYLEGLKRQQMTQEFNDQQTMRNAYANNTKVDSSGNATLDRAGMMKDLAQNAPHLVPQQQMAFATQDFNAQKMQYEKLHQNLDMMAQLAGGVSDQQSYERFLKQGAALGGDMSQFPQQYDPKFVSNYQAQALSAKDQIENKFKQQDLGVKQQELAVHQQEANTKDRQARIEGQKLDLELRKDKAQQNQETLNSLQSLRSNPALQRAETNVLSAKNINDLAEQVRDPKTGQIDLNKMNPQQIELFNHELLRMASGGSGSEHDLESLKPGTPQFAMAQIRQKLTGNVSPAQAAQYIQQGLDYANTLSKSSSQFLYQNAKHVVDSKRRYLDDPDAKQYESWLGDMKSGKAFFGDMVPQEGQASQKGGGAPQQTIHPDLVGMNLEQLKALRAKVAAGQQASNK